jgi:hypothetical protein
LLLDAAGRPEVHVFAGEVRADPTNARGEALPGGRSIENSGAFIDTTLQMVSAMPLNPAPFARLRPEVRVSDSAVRDGSHANENFGAAPQLAVKNSIAGYSWETFLRFDLSGVKGPIREATVRLVPIKVGQAMENSAAVVASSELWSEQLISWDTKPPSAAAFASWTVTGTQSVEFDVTDQVQEALSADKRLTLRIFAPKRKRGSAYVQYGSREGPADFRPQLLITPLVDVQTRRPARTNDAQSLSRIFERDHSILGLMQPRATSGTLLPAIEIPGGRVH